MNNLYKHLMDLVDQKTKTDLSSTYEITKEMSEKVYVIPPKRIRYLSEIAENNRAYDEQLERQIKLAEKLYVLHKSIDELDERENKDVIHVLSEKIKQIQLDFDARNWKTIQDWESKYQSYQEDQFIFKVRGKELRVSTKSESLSFSKIPKDFPKVTNILFLPIGQTL